MYLLLETHVVMLSCRDVELFRSNALQDLDMVRNKEPAPPDNAHKSSTSFESTPLTDHQLNADASAAPSNGNINQGDQDSSRSDKCRDKSLEVNEVADTNQSNGLKENAPLKPTKLIIRTKKKIGSPSKVNLIANVEKDSSARGEFYPENHVCMEPNLVLKVPEAVEDTGRASSLRLQDSYSDKRMTDAAYGGEKFYRAKTDSAGCDSDVEENTSALNDHHYGETDVHGSFSDAIRRTRSIKMTATSQEPNAMNHSFKLRRSRASVGPSRNAENSSMELSDQLLLGSRSTRNRSGGYKDYVSSSSSRMKSNFSLRKLSWLTLSEHEEGYRYIPQLGDEVVYLRQVTLDYLSLMNLVLYCWYYVQLSVIAICTSIFCSLMIRVMKSS